MFCAAIMASLICLVVGCGTAAASAVGVSSAPPDSEPEPARAAQPPERWQDFERARSWPEVARPLVSLVHRRDGSLMRVRVETEFLDAYRQLSHERPMPDGARVVAFLEAPEGALLGAYVLEKRERRWRGAELDAAGNVLVVDTATCLRCHSQAASDYLFDVTQRLPVEPSAR
jgi:hypothetical protein